MAADWLLRPVFFVDPPWECTAPAEPDLATNFWHLATTACGSTDVSMWFSLWMWHIACHPCAAIVPSTSWVGFQVRLPGIFYGGGGIGGPSLEGLAQTLCVRIIAWNSPTHRICNASLDCTLCFRNMCWTINERDRWKSSTYICDARKQ